MDISLMISNFVRELEKNNRFMDIVSNYPADIYLERNSEEYKNKFSSYAKYAGYKEMVKFHGSKLVHIPRPRSWSVSTALDIGGGAGYLSFMLRRLGYDVLCTDIPELENTDKILTKLRDALGVETFYLRMSAFKKLPRMPKAPFDLISATNLVFDTGWDYAEYDFFLHDLANNMNPFGAIYLYFNPPQGDKIFNSTDLLSLFIDNGADVIVPHRSFLFRNVSSLQGGGKYNLKYLIFFISLYTNSSIK